jgi:hypothetical protein
MKIRYNLYAQGKIDLGMFRGYSTPCLKAIGPDEGFETEADALNYFKMHYKYSDYTSCVVLKRYVYE